MPEKPKIIVRIEPTDGSPKWSCDLCGTPNFTPSDLGAVFNVAGGEDQHVCERCLRAGPKAATRHLREQAKRLCKKAAELRRITDGHEFVFPPMKAWDDFTDRRFPG